MAFSLHFSFPLPHLVHDLKNEHGRGSEESVVQEGAWYLAEQCDVTNVKSYFFLFSARTHGQSRAVPLAAAASCLPSFLSSAEFKR